MHRTGGGLFPNDDDYGRNIMSLEPWDNTRRDMIILLLRTILENEMPGDFVKLRVYKCFTTRLLHHYAPERALHLFDTFEGFPDQSMRQNRTKLTIQSQKDYSLILR